MASIDIPDIIPAFLVSGYGIQYKNEVLRTVMATGRARQRVMYESVTGMSGVSFLLTNTQAQVFEMWYLYEIKSAEWFNAFMKTPLGYSKVDCRFISRPSKAWNGSRWQYSMQIEVRDEQILTDEEYGDLIGN